MDDNATRDVRLLKAVDVATVLNCSKSMAYHLMQSGEIPTVKIRKLIRVREADLQEYIQNSRVSQ